MTPECLLCLFCRGQNIQLELAASSRMSTCVGYTSFLLSLLGNLSYDLFLSTDTFFFSKLINTLFKI